MEISLKTGPSMQCEYTGTDCEVMVRLRDDEGQFQTGWLSRQALEQALRVIGSLDRGPVPVATVPVEAGAQPAPVASPAPVRRPTPVPEVNLEVVNSFNREIQKLQREADREEPEAGKHKGIREIDLRALVAKYRPLFGSQGAAAMFRVLNVTTGMERHRFELFWNQKEEKMMVDTGDDD